MSSTLFTRFEKSGPIFSRINGLIRSGQLKWEDRPLWYDAYVLFPPFNEPVGNKKFPKHNEAVRDLFYSEDVKISKKEPIAEKM